MPTLALLIGLWTSTCIQTQISSNMQGWVIEGYHFEANGDYVFKRIWHKDPLCSEEFAQDIEKGQITLGSQLSGFFISGKTFEADFTNTFGADLGAISISDEKYLKVSRGMTGSSMRNTMVGLFQYKKQ